jgi:hypothetical protein
LTEKQVSADPVIVGIRLPPEGDEKMALLVNQQAPGDAGKDGATGASQGAAELMPHEKRLQESKRVQVVEMKVCSASLSG